MSRTDLLTDAIKAVDLPAIIAEFFPESKCEPGKPGSFFAAWRGNSETEALSLSRKQQVWLWHDFGVGEGGNAFDFLVGPAKMGRQEAAHYLLERAGMPLEGSAARSEGKHLRPIPADASTAFTEAKSVKIPAMANRGFNGRLIQNYGIISDNGRDALIPITSPEGVILQVKRRLLNSDKPGRKYRYEYTGNGAPPWCSANSRKAPVLFIIEGELNGMIAHAAMQEAGDSSVGVMGVAGAENDLYQGLCHGKTVYVYADDDEAGAKAKVAWAEAARDDGAKSVHVCPPNDMDFCDYAGRHGREDLAMLLTALRAAATQVFGAMDRMLGSISVREHLESTERYFNGGVIHPTGFRELDRTTGGIRESGIYAIGGLPSMGKSAVLRRLLIEHVRAGGIAKLYSPDQSPRAVYRLLASVLSGVGVQEARTRDFKNDTLQLYGTPEAAMKALRQAYEHVLLELGQRFQVTEEGEAKAIFDDMERAVDQGVTMFGIDYIQVIEPQHHADKDGQAAKDLEKLSHKLRVPAVVAMQLAKYKFPVTRKLGTPVATDIEGPGAYFASSEMVMMIHNDQIYRRKYGGPDYEGIGDGDFEGRILIVKDKEGDGNLEFKVSWVPRLLTYRDSSVWKLEHEQKGLM